MKGSVIVACVLLAVSPGAGGQTLNPPPQGVLGLDRPLLPAEIAGVLDGVRRAIDGKKARISAAPGGAGPEVLFGPDGRPRLMRATSGYSGMFWSISGGSGGGSVQAPLVETRVDVVMITEYTGAPARACDGSTRHDDLVIEYEHRNAENGWTARARQRTSIEVMTPIFDMLAGATPTEAGGRRQIGDRAARALVAPWKLPPGAIGDPPSGMMQSLWIDVEALLPLRWSVSVPAAPARGIPTMPDYGLALTFDPAIDLKPPEGVARPDCIK